ncbi:MAG: hypothetical protein CMH30_03755 [Micavibrio sp.]|nr:hypothetical protein [Micavibrio sp.]|tara:strand:+ start:361 stop:957 length:597 start_codon:yes stop_codon:yes gene_type:complete
MTLTIELFFAGLAIFLMVLRYVFYFSSIYKKETRPHVFSWLNWGIVVGIGAAAQLKLDSTGMSGWVLAIVSVSCLLIAGLAVFVGEKNITRGDWLTFLGALAIIPVWQATEEPVIALILVVTIDFLSYYPSFRKTWIDPTSEPPFSTFLAGARYFCLLFTIQDPTWENMLYPVFLMSIDWVYAFMIVIRRSIVRKQLT